MLNRKLWMLFAILLSSQLSAQSINPGFSCDEQLNYSEMAICSSSYLSSLDKYLNILYRQYQELSFSPATLKENQLTWWRERNSCETRDCIDKVYDSRIREIINGIKRIDIGFSALEPGLVVKHFSEREKSYSPVSIEATIDRLNNEDADLFPETFFRIVSSEIHSFERIERNIYKFHYSYQAAYKNLPPQTIRGSFIVDDSSDIVSIEIENNSSFRKIIDDIVKASRTDSTDHLEVMRNVLVELRSEGINTASKFLEYFEMEPAKTLTGSDVISCNRHDDQLYLIKGSVLADILECSWGHEIIDTYDGDDEIDGGWGDEIIAARVGSDTIDGSWGNEMVYAGPGDDYVNGSRGSLTLLYGANWGNDVVVGNCNLIVFSSENEPEDILWKDQILITNRRTGDRIEFSHPCKMVHFSNISFD